MCRDITHCRLVELCPGAHSLRELEEWRRRREVQLSKQLQKGVYSDKILKEVLNQSNSLAPMVENLAGVKVVCDEKEKIKMACRSSAATWNFIISSQKFLKGISMLHVENLQHFSLSEVCRVRNGNITELKADQKQCTIDDKEETVDKSTNYQYRIKLKFSTKVFGSFKQSLILDFGTKPLLYKTVEVTVAPDSIEDDLNSAQESILTVANVWEESNSNIIKFEPAPPKVQNDEDALLAKYPIPQPYSLKLTKVVGESLSLENYRARFHQLLYMEEISQYQEVTGFNAALNIHVTERYLLSASPSNVSTAKYARPGELFGRIELNSQLSDDSKAGKLILTKCSSILLKNHIEPAVPEKKKGKKKPEKKRKSLTSNTKIWECLIEDTAKSVIYVRLPAALVLDMNLQTDMRVKAEVQFKLSRVALVEMHYAVDRIPDLKVVYPSVKVPPSIPWSPSHQWKENLDPQLNLKQKEAVLAITAPPSVILPPILIIGPYGTGKTFTVGKAIEMLLQESWAKILVCTHSNSAADLYIKDYIDPAITKGNIKKKVLRIYYYNRWVQTVHPTVQKYCLIETEEITSTRRFRIPTHKDLVEPDLVVATLSTSRCLAQQLSVGHFTHILLDEAAQALETEAIMPLILANSSTRVVLAGDHMQLEPEVISSFALEKRFNLSMLERLYDHYPKSFPCKILLCENYRSHEEIVAFTSELFYEQKLTSSGKQPPHPKWFPLTFFTARGEDVQDVNSTSFYNNYEVGEIVDRLIELRKHWPKVWGKKEEIEIGVVTPYHDQVMRIRAELRKKRLHNISVERVQNVQGKQYRVIFISTVRTRDSCMSQPDTRTDFGFLSSAKLLNTAVTRAQSLVAVVGDPVALCSVGRCRKLWEKFLETCSKNRSLVGYTWKELTANLEAIELKNIYGLNPMAKEFIPRALVYNYEKAPPGSAVSPGALGAFPPRFPGANLAGGTGGGGLSPGKRPHVPPPAAAKGVMGGLGIRPVLPPGLRNPGPLPVTGIGPLGNMPAVTGIGTFPALSPMGLLPPRLGGYPLLSPRAYYPGLLPPSFLPNPGLSMSQQPLIPPTPPPPFVGAASVMPRSPLVPPMHLQPRFPVPSEIQTTSATPRMFGQQPPPPNRNGVGEKSSHSAMDRILPPETDLHTILQSRSAQLNWYNLLRSIGKETEASAFQELVITEGGEVLGDHDERINGNSNGTGDSGQEEVEIPTTQPTQACGEEERDGMTSMFEYLMADFDKHEAAANNSNTPLYMRRGQPSEFGGGDMQVQPDDIPVNSSTAVGHQQQPNHYLSSSSNSISKDLFSAQHHPPVASSMQQQAGSMLGGPDKFMLQYGGLVPELQGLNLEALRRSQAQQSRPLDLLESRRLQELYGGMMNQVERSRLAATGPTSRQFEDGAQLLHHHGLMLDSRGLEEEALLRAGAAHRHQLEQQQRRLAQHLDEGSATMRQEGGLRGLEQEEEAGRARLVNEEGRTQLVDGEGLLQQLQRSEELRTEGRSFLEEFRKQTASVDDSFKHNGTNPSMYGERFERQEMNGGGGIYQQQDLQPYRLEGTPPHHLLEGTPPRSLPRDSESPELLVPTYARIVRTQPRTQEEDTLTKIRNLGTYGFQNLG